MSHQLVYVAVHASPDLEASLAQKVIWAWNTTIVGVQSPLKCTLDHPIQSLHPVTTRDSGHELILVLHTNQYMTLLSLDLQRKLALHTPNTISQDASIVYTSPHWIVVKTPHRLLVHSLHIVAVGGLYDIQVSLQGNVHYDADVLAVTMDSEDKLLVARKSRMGRFLSDISKPTQQS